MREQLQRELETHKEQVEISRARIEKIEALLVMLDKYPEVSAAIEAVSQAMQSNQYQYAFNSYAQQQGQMAAQYGALLGR